MNKSPQDSSAQTPADVRPSPFVAGDMVRRISNTARVGTVVEHQWNAALNAWMLKVKIGSSIQALPDFELEKLPSSSPDPWMDLLASRFASPASLKTLLTHERLRHLPAPIGERFIPAHAQLIPAQYIPLLKLLEAPTPRLLLLDARGTGRSVSIGYIVREFMVRRQARQVLIFAPLQGRAALTAELRRRFGFTLSILSAQQFRSHLLAVRRGWELPPMCAVVALEALATFDVPELLERYRPPIDLVVLDAADRLGDTDAPLFRAARALSHCTDGMVLATPQPIQSRPEELTALLSLLGTHELKAYDSLSLTATAQVMTRTLEHLEAGAQAEAAEGLEMFLSHPLHLGMDLDPLVKQLQAQLASDLPLSVEARRTVARALEGLHPAFARMTRTLESPAPQSLCVPLPIKIPQQPIEQELMSALIHSLRHLLPFADTPARQDALYMPMRLLFQGLTHGSNLLMDTHRGPALWLEQPLDREQDVEQDILEPPPPVELPDDVRAKAEQPLLELLQEPLDIYQDIRLDVLLHALTSLWAEDVTEGRPERKVVIFTRHLRPLRALAQNLTLAGHETRMLAGALPLEEQRIRLHQFSTDPKLKVLVTTDRGGAGLDFTAASVLVHYELPWEPELLVQRLRRVARIGQTHPRLLIVPLIAEGTLEDQLLYPLYNGLGLFEEPERVEEGAIDRDTVLTLLNDTLLQPGESEETSPTSLPERIENAIQQGMARVQAHREAVAHAEGFFARDAGLRAQLKSLSGPLGWPLASSIRMLFIQLMAVAFPGVRLTGDPIQGVGMLDLTPAAQKAFQSWATTRQGGLKLQAMSLASRMVHGPLPISWHADAALVHPECEFMMPGHALLEFALQQLDPQLLHHGRAFAVSIKATALEAAVATKGALALEDASAAPPPESSWLLGVWSVRLEGPKEGRQLEVFAIQTQSQEVATPQRAAALLQGVLLHGEEWASEGSDIAQLTSISQQLRQLWDARKSALKADVQTVEALRLARRRARALEAAELRVKGVSDELDAFHALLREGHSEPETVRCAEGRLKARREVRDALKSLPPVRWADDLESQLLALVLVHVKGS